MYLKRTILFLAALMCLVQCSADTEDQPENSFGLDGTNTTSIADVVNEFGYKLTLSMLKENHDNNIVLSPTSVAGLLAMTLLGTIGKTHDELATALGFSTDILENRKNHERFGDLLRALNSSDVNHKTLYADAIFVDTSSKIRELYRGYLSLVYNGEARSVDFARPDEVKGIINKWVDSHTEGKIEKFLDKPLPVTTKAVLLSALYFRGQWKTPFIVSQTREMDFKKPSGATVLADLMVNVGQFKYQYSPEDGYHIIALPYNDSTTTLYALKPYPPKRRLSLYNLLTNLTYAKINQEINKMEAQTCVLRIPKMDLKIKSKLEEPLKALGVQSLFTAGQANFGLMVDGNMISNTTEEILSRITSDVDGPKVTEDGRSVKDVLGELPNPGIHVDSVIHDVKLTINEYGTEAVAATSGTLARSAQLFLADSPFYMFIRNDKTKLVTFSAVINDPTA